MAKFYFVRWLCSRLEPVPAPEPAPLAAALTHYRQMLAALDAEPQTLLAVLLARDRVAVALPCSRALAAAQVKELVALDGQLRRCLETDLPQELSQWRTAMHPDAAAWWWVVDQKTAVQEKQNDLPWVLLTGILWMLTVPLALEIIKRLWDGAPDMLSVLGTLLTLIITGSPLFKRGQELAEWALQRIPWLKPRFRAEAMAALAALAFVLVLVGRVWIVPQSAMYYNNRGHAELRAGNLAAAQQTFRRAVALDPERVVPYQNLADVYQRIGRLDEARSWYQKAIERDLNFAPAYSSLGHLYNTQGEYAQAERVLLAGLDYVEQLADPNLKTLTRYQLLADLGWSYLEQEQLGLAQTALEAALALENDVKAWGEKQGVECRLSLPHYTLAQVYEQLGRSQDARQQWEESLRFLDPENWADREMLETALQHLKE